MSEPQYWADQPQAPVDTSDGLPQPQTPRPRKVYPTRAQLRAAEAQGQTVDVGAMPVEHPPVVDDAVTYPSVAQPAELTEQVAEIPLEQNFCTSIDNAGDVNTDAGTVANVTADVDVDATGVVAADVDVAGADAEAVIAVEEQSETETEPGKRKKKRKGLGLLRETAIIVVSALVLSWLIKTFLMQAFFIPSQSMEGTLAVGDRVMVSRLVPRFLDINRGDVVVFHDPGGWLEPHAVPDRGPVANVFVTGLTAVGLMPQDSGEHLIKRVIGMPGDHVVCCNAEGLITINGVAIDETLYIKPGSIPSQIEFDVVVPDGHLFVLGDNRQNSTDSRYHLNDVGGGFVPIDNVVGTAFSTVWPLDRLDWHRNPGSVFEHVPNP